jgi:hypothetical protein
MTGSEKQITWAKKILLDLQGKTDNFAGNTKENCIMDFVRIILQENKDSAKWLIDHRNISSVYTEAENRIRQIVLQNVKPGHEILYNGGKHVVVRFGSSYITIQLCGGNNGINLVDYPQYYIKYIKNE